MYSVRFHLGKGVHFRHWQVKKKGCKPVYHHPDNASLLLVNCKLINKVNDAKRVHAEGVKDVSGWIDCESVEVVELVGKVVGEWDREGEGVEDSEGEASPVVEGVGDGRVVAALDSLQTPS